MDLVPRSTTDLDPSKPSFDDRYLEIWNIVFMQHQNDGQGGLLELATPCIDTGMGLERITSVLQGKASNYDTEEFEELRNFLRSRSSRADHAAENVVMDHLRAAAFLVCEGVMPSNVGRGYVLRRLIRRASVFGVHSLGLHDVFLADLVPVLAQQVQLAHPEILLHSDSISQVLHSEQTVFARTLKKGTQVLAKRLQSPAVFDEAAAYDMFETHGLPLDMIQTMAKDLRHVDIDVDLVHDTRPG